MHNEPLLPGVDELDHINDSLKTYAHRYGQMILRDDFTADMAQARVREVNRKLGAVPPGVGVRPNLVGERERWERIQSLLERKAQLQSVDSDNN